MLVKRYDFLFAVSAVSQPLVFYTSFNIAFAPFDFFVTVWMGNEPLPACPNFKQLHRNLFVRICCYLSFVPYSLSCVKENL